MNKENQLLSPHTPKLDGGDDSLTPEQRARISLKLKTAQALLSRKRPRLSLPPKAAVEVDNHSNSVHQQERLPLRDLRINGVAPVMPSDCNHSIEEFVRTPPSMCNSGVRTFYRSTITNGYESSLDENLSTPINNELCLSDFSSSSRCSSIATVLDEEFDTSILEQIDALCEKSSATVLDRSVDTAHDGSCTRIPEQKADISLKFKAAKAHLTHQHPCLPKPACPLPLRASDNFGMNFGSHRERVPPRDSQINVALQTVPRGSEQSNEKTVKTSLLISNSGDNSYSSSVITDGDERSRDENCSTSTNHHVQLFDCFSESRSTVASVLDEDFDTSILERIDLLCEEKSAIFLERPVDTGQDSHQQSESTVENSKLSFPSKLNNTEGTQVDGSLSPLLNVNVTEGKGLLDMPEPFLKYMKSLNDDQLDAASTKASRPLMVVAGPGSGKTSTMVGRVLMLLHQGMDPSHILAMTFTTAAATEMRDRIAAVAGKEIAKALTISTFHSFSLQLCRTHAGKLDRTSEFLIYGCGQQRRAVVEAVRLLESEKDVQNLAGSCTNSASDAKKVHNFKDKAQKWLKFVTQAKASGKTPEECRQEGDEVGAKVLINYNGILRSCNALDYHDFISCSVKLLTDYPEVFEECQALWKAIIVDEFQDTSTMQYRLLRLLASHGQITVVGDDDQSIFSFNGADISGFDSFRKDFPNYKEVRLGKNYRSTRCIVEAAASLIQHNVKRCKLKEVLTDNSTGSKIMLKQCHNEDAQCAYVVDKILENVSNSSDVKCSFGNIAILYRRQVSGRVFQATFRDRKVPFNVHGIAFYRKKVIKAIMAMLKTTIPGCDDGSYRQVFKTMLPYDKEEKKKTIEHIEKVSTIRNCSFISSASDIFNAKISGTFKRSQLSHGRKVLVTLEMVSKLVCREQSLSSVITSVANLLPQRYLLEKRAVINSDGGRLLNEDDDLRSVLEYLLDDVSNFLSEQDNSRQEGGNELENKGCARILKAFLDYISEREKENFRSRRHDNEDSVTLTTIHQSKGLEWDIVFIVKANESEIPLLHEHNGMTKESGNSIEEERRLLYVAMTRARKKLFILYVIMDSNWQVLHPSRFLQEIPSHLLEIQGDLSSVRKKAPCCNIPSEAATVKGSPVVHDSCTNRLNEASEELSMMESCDGNNFLKRFNVEDRGLVSRIFHQWAKKKSFQNPKRLLDKVAFVINERLTCKKCNSKDVLVALKSSLKCGEAFEFAKHVITWEQIPPDQRQHLMREKQEHFQKLRMETAMSSSTPTSKQIGYLQSLGCTVVPESKLHASRLIEQYKSL